MTYKYHVFTKFRMTCFLNYLNIHLINLVPTAPTYVYTYWTLPRQLQYNHMFKELPSAFSLFLSFSLPPHNVHNVYLSNLYVYICTYILDCFYCIIISNNNYCSINYQNINHNYEWNALIRQKVVTTNFRRQMLWFNCDALLMHIFKQ